MFSSIRTQFETDKKKSIDFCSIYKWIRFFPLHSEFLNEERMKKMYLLTILFGLLSFSSIEFWIVSIFTLISVKMSNIKNPNNLNRFHAFFSSTTTIQICVMFANIAQYVNTTNSVHILSLLIAEVYQERKKNTFKFLWLFGNEWAELFLSVLLSINRLWKNVQTRKEQNAHQK